METRITSQTATRAGTGYLAFNDGPGLGNTDETLYLQKLVSDTKSSNYYEHQLAINDTKLRYITYKNNTSIDDRELRWKLNSQISEYYGQWQQTVNDYSTVVWPLVRLSAASSSTSDLFSGELYCYRGNGAALLSAIMQFNVVDDYSSDRKVRVDFIKHYGASDLDIYFCKFKYNNVWYGGLRVRVASTSSTVSLRGVATNYPLVDTGVIVYETHQGGSSTIVNSEINSSIIFNSVNCMVYFNDTPYTNFNDQTINYRLLEGVNNSMLCLAYNGWQDITVEEAYLTTVRTFFTRLCGKIIAAEWWNLKYYFTRVLRVGSDYDYGFTYRDKTNGEIRGFIWSFYNYWKMFIFKCSYNTSTTAINSLTIYDSQGNSYNS